MPADNTTRRQFTKSVALGVGASALGRSQSGRRPNILFICSDQHSYKYAGYAGHPHVQTPHLDAIARRGVVFENAYCGSPVCVPGRACLMTGLYPHETNSFCNSTVWDGSRPTWGTRLRNAGYHTEATGKFDLNDDFDIGFKEVETSHGHRHRPDITSLFRSPVCYRVNERPQVDGRPRDKDIVDKSRAQRAEDFIRKTAPNLDRPWAYYVGFILPHPPFVAHRKYWEMYSPDEVDVPDVGADYLESQHLAFQELRHFKRIATPISEVRIRRARAGYYALITEMDDYIGRFWKALEETGQLDNTIVVYTSDHGEALGDHGLWLKNNLLEPAAHIPLVIAGAGIPQGGRIDRAVAHVDLVRTLLEWGGVEDDVPGLRGHSLVNVMNGGSGDHPGWAYSESHSEGNATGSFMIRKGPWKYIHFTWYDDLLFNLDEDPGEKHDRSKDPSARGVVEELRGILLSQVEPEEVTRSAYRAQEKMLAGFASKMSEEELAKMFESRMGKGLSRVLAARAKRDLT